MYLDHVNVIVIVCMYRIQLKLECLHYGLVYKDIVVYIYIYIYTNKWLFASYYNIARGL